MTRRYTYEFLNLCREFVNKHVSDPALRESHLERYFAGDPNDELFEIAKARHIPVYVGDSQVPVVQRSDLTPGAGPPDLTPDQYRSLLERVRDAISAIHDYEDTAILLGEELDEELTLAVWGNVRTM